MQSIFSDKLLRRFHERPETVPPPKYAQRQMLILQNLNNSKEIEIPSKKLAASQNKFST